MTIKAYAATNRIRLSPKQSSELGRAATALCRQRGIKWGTQVDATFGHVNVYHRDILEEIFRPFSNL
jgi:hypothetical protein